MYPSNGENFIIRRMSDNPKMAMTPKGLRLLIAGALVIIAGLILLSGGGSKDPQVFNYAMFDFRRLVAAPLVIICGIIVEVVAIMGLPSFKKKK